MGPGVAPNYYYLLRVVLCFLYCKFDNVPDVREDDLKCATGEKPATNSRSTK